jgi:hypothetical protein
MLQQINHNFDHDICLLNIYIFVSFSVTVRTLRVATTRQKAQLQLECIH